MIRILILLGLLYLLYKLFFKKGSLGSIFGETERPKAGQKRKQNLLEAEEMAACDLCGAFIARRAGEIQNGRFICRPSCHRS